MVAPAYRGVARWHSSGRGRTTPNPLPRAEGGWSPGIPDIKMADGEETWVKNRVAKDRLARKRELRLTDCLEPASASSVCCEDFAAAAVDGAAAGERFFADFDIEILRSAHGGVPPHHRSPTGGRHPAGQDLASALGAPGIDDNYRSNRLRLPVLSDDGPKANRATFDRSSGRVRDWFDRTACLVPGSSPPSL
jgi:hypothetical protein